MDKVAFNLKGVASGFKKAWGATKKVVSPVTKPAQKALGVAGMMWAPAMLATMPSQMIAQDRASREQSAINAEQLNYWKNLNKSAEIYAEINGSPWPSALTGNDGTSNTLPDRDLQKEAGAAPFESLGTVVTPSRGDSGTAASAAAAEQALCNWLLSR